MWEKMGDNGTENVDGTEDEESEDKGMRKRRAGNRSGWVRIHAYRLSGSGMEMADERAAVRETMRASGERVWRDNWPPLAGEVTWMDRALVLMVTWISCEVSKMGERGMMAALGCLGMRRAERMREGPSAGDKNLGALERRVSWF